MFGQTGPKVGSFDAGYGSTQMVRLVGQKKAREIWFLARLYNAQQVRFLKQAQRQSVLLRCEKLTYEAPGLSLAVGQQKQPHRPI